MQWLGLKRKASSNWLQLAGTDRFASLNDADTFCEMRRQAISSLCETCTYRNLTYSIVQSPSCEANWFAASQEIPRISQNPKVHYRTHKHPPLVSILASPIQSIYPHPISWRSIKISTHLRLGLPSGLLPSGFPTKALYTPSPHPYVPHAQPITFFSILSPTQYWVRST